MNHRNKDGTILRSAFFCIIQLQFDQESTVYLCKKEMSQKYETFLQYIKKMRLVNVCRMKNNFSLLKDVELYFQVEMYATDDTIEVRNFYVCICSTNIFEEK